MELEPSSQGPAERGGEAYAQERRDDSSEQKPFHEPGETRPPQEARQGRASEND